MTLDCWYCGKTGFKNRQALYRHYGWCAAYAEFKETGIYPPGFEARKQRYIEQQTKHPMPDYMRKKPVRVPGYLE